MASPGKPQQLSPGQARAVMALLGARTVADAAAQARVGRRSLDRWLDDPDFQVAVKVAQDNALELAVRRLAGGAGAALDTLQVVMEDPTTPAGVRVRCAGLWLDAVLRWLELRDLAARVAILEQQLVKP
jgi:hypothetical protein